MKFIAHVAEIDSKCPCGKTDTVIVKTKSIYKHNQPSKTVIHLPCAAGDIDWSTTPVIGRVIGYYIVILDNRIIKKWHKYHNNICDFNKIKGAF